MSRVHVRCPTCSSLLETACSGGDRIINVRCGSCSTVFSAELPRPVQTPRWPALPVGACDWQCTTCTLVNKVDRTNCSACGGSQPWTCRFCGRSNNPSHAAACAGCKREGAGRAAAASPLRSVEQAPAQPPPILCPVCTLRNSATATRCEACEANLGGSGGNGGGDGGNGGNGGDGRKGAWRGGRADSGAPYLECPRCTVHNPPTAIECATCGHVFAPPVPPVPHMPAVLPVFDTASGRFRDSVPQAGASQPVNLSRETSLGGERSQTIVERRARHEAEAAMTLKRVLAYCEQNKEPFVDDAFPPAPRSLFLNGKGWSTNGAGVRS